MRIVHTSDLHIDSPLTSRLSELRAEERRRELIFNFERLIEKTRELGAAVMIIAGDLFDKERVSSRAKNAVLSAIRRAEDIVFLYLPGNHERDALAFEELPKNMKTFGRSWTYFETDSLLFAGRSECAEGMFSELRSVKNKKTIAVLHGEAVARSGEDGKIGLSELRGTGIAYLALGHYHTYSRKTEGGCAVVYSGTPEGRGFDEAGEKGFSLIEYENGVLTDRFIPFASRRLHDLKIDVSGAAGTWELENIVENRLRDIPQDDLVRVTLVGEHPIGLIKNVRGIAYRYSDVFYYFEIHDASRVAILASDFRYDKTLKGEFVRLVMGDEGLSETEKKKIIAAGLSALAGEIAEEL